MRTILASLALASTTSSAWAHGGHGMAGTHLHATDVFGLLALAVVLGWWIARRNGR